MRRDDRHISLDILIRIILYRERNGEKGVVETQEKKNKDKVIQPSGKMKIVGAKVVVLGSQGEMETRVLGSGHGVGESWEGYVCMLLVSESGLSLIWLYLRSRAQSLSDSK